MVLSTIGDKGLLREVSVDWPGLTQREIITDKYLDITKIILMIPPILHKSFL